MSRQPGSLSAERRAIAVVRGEEEARGCTVATLSKVEERRHGCDFLSVSPDGATDYVEVKGWGESLLRADGSFSSPADINCEQYQRACTEGARFRLEIVANLAAEQAGTGAYERLTLTGHDVKRLAEPWKYRLPLAEFADRVRR